jgi:S1-C subfamily serine protease
MTDITTIVVPRNQHNILFDGRSYTAKLVGSDPLTDLALKIDEKIFLLYYLATVIPLKLENG